ncbi:uncharacterized protein LOC135400080 isoform X2 [Ornithodoros turicata]|uniref:uncharacterized protein LOC135400080 isoform X2 n=1 Tax=Ornithodoros turicata TaxID=34597 RepID=UPI003138C2E1
MAENVNDDPQEKETSLVLHAPEKGPSGSAQPGTPEIPKPGGDKQTAEPKATDRQAPAASVAEPTLPVHNEVSPVGSGTKDVAKRKPKRKSKKSRRKTNVSPTEKPVVEEPVEKEQVVEPYESPVEIEKTKPRSGEDVAADVNVDDGKETTEVYLHSVVTETSPKRKVAPLGARTIVTAVCVCLLLIAFTNPKVQRLRTNQTDWCGSSWSCEAAADYLRNAIDLTVSPCVDFYKHICKKWTKPIHFDRGYLDEQLQNFRKRIYDNLDTTRDNPNHRELGQAISVFYKSCKKFMTGNNDVQKVLQEVVDVLHINTTTWRSSRTFKDIFAHLIAAAYRGCPSAVTVKYEARKKTIELYIDVGPTLSAAYQQAIDSKLLTYLADVVKFYSGGILSFNVTEIDNKLGGMYATVGNGSFLRSAPSVLGTLMDMELWAPPLEIALPSPDLSGHSFVHVRGIEILKKAFEAFDALASNDRNAYFFLLVTSRLLAHDFRSRNHTIPGAQTECLLQASKHFSNFFQYVVNSFQPFEAQKDIDGMQTKLRDTLRKRMTTSAWIATPRRKQVSSVVSRVKVWTGQIQTAVPASPSFYAYLGTSFIHNVAVLLEGGVMLPDVAEDAVDLPLSQWQFNGTVGYVPGYNTIVASTPVLRPDVFHRDTRMNHATVGAFLAEAFVKAGLDVIDRYPSGEERNAAALACYKYHIGRAVGKENVSAELKEFVALKLALNVTYGMHRNGQDANVEGDRMFFRRFCLTSCGTSSGLGNVLPGNVRCNFTLLGLRAFAEAFGCSAKPSHDCDESESPELWYS